MFECKAEKHGYCKIWLRECVGREHCELAIEDAPCMRCINSSPKIHLNCENCEFYNWKKENYID